MGKMFLLKRNDMSLKYLFDQPDLNARKASWLDFLSEYKFEVKHIKGKENKIVDALSHRIHLLYKIIICQTSFDLRDIIRLVSKNN